MQDTRRTLLKAPALLLLPATALGAASPTPSATAGPFYPASIPLDSDADLVQVDGMLRAATGIVSHLTGKVLDGNGCPLANATVEIWQCDAFGAYHHPRDRGDIGEPEFQGYGTTVTNAEGGYRFRTIRPVSYPGRTPHIHVRVGGSGIPSLTTQLYIKGEPMNRRDFLYNRIPEERRGSVLAAFPSTESESLTVIPEFDIILGYTAEC